MLIFPLFGPMVLWMIPQPTGTRWRLSGTSPSLGARRLNSLDPFLSQRQSYRQDEYDMHGISKFLLFSFKLTEEALKYILYKVIETT